MIFDIVLAIFMTSIVFFIIGMFGDYEIVQRIPAHLMSILFAIVSAAGFMGMEIPYVTTTVYQDGGMSQLCWGIVVINLLSLALYWLIYRDEDRISGWLP